MLGGAGRCHTGRVDSGGWGDVDPHWRSALQLAWESFQAGSPPVGAVVIDGAGDVVARGRSRRGESSAPPNQLSGSRLAHAEINALAQLALDEHAGLALYVTLEPCFLCAAAMAMSHIPVVRFAGEDPMWRFVQALPESHPVLRDRWPQIVGPMPGFLGAFATLLPILERLRRNPAGLRVIHYELANPALLAIGRRIIKDEQLDAFVALSIDRAYEQVWQALACEETVMGSARPGTSHTGAPGDNGPVATGNVTPSPGSSTNAGG
jgi:tRNA(adenine34) deaminase